MEIEAPILDGVLFYVLKNDVVHHQSSLVLCAARKQSVAVFAATFSIAFVHD
jgi:hypothetical protein